MGLLSYQNHLVCLTCKLILPKNDMGEMMSFENCSNIWALTILRIGDICIHIWNTLHLYMRCCSLTRCCQWFNWGCTLPCFLFRAFRAISLNSRWNSKRGFESNDRYLLLVFISYNPGICKENLYSRNVIINTYE